MAVTHLDEAGYPLYILRTYSIPTTYNRQRSQPEYKEYRVGEDGEVENSSGGHGEQYGQRACTSSTLMSGFPMKGYGCA